MRVCVLEPSAPVRRRLVGLIEELPDVDVVFCSGRKDAECAVETIHPDVVILDQRTLSGDRLARIARIKRTNGAASILVLTNDASDEYRRRCLAAGADFFLDKSLEFAEVVRILRRRAPRRNGVKGASR